MSQNGFISKELLEVLVWPATISIFGLAALYIFRAPITRLIDRIRRVSREGVDTYNPQQQQVEGSRRESAEELMHSFGGGVILQEQEDAIRRELEQRNLEGPEAINVLIRYFAATRIAYLCERIYTYIYGSQISLLQHLNQNRPEGSATDDLRLFYDTSVTLWPDLYRGYTFEQYINFLVSSLLIRNNDGRFYITNFGVEFLRYLTDTGHLLNKVG